MGPSPRSDSENDSWGKEKHPNDNYTFDWFEERMLKRSIALILRFLEDE